MPKNKAYINHFQSVCCAGGDSEEIFDTICKQKTGISQIKKESDSKIVAIGKIHFDYNIDTLLESTCKDVLNQSNLKDFSNTLLLVGSSVGGMQLSESLFFRDQNYKQIDPKLHIIDSISYRLKRFFSFKDDISFSTACTSSANAIGFGYEVLKKGLFQNVLVVGFDTLSKTTVYGFDALGVLSSEPCRPFDKDRSGMNVAEGIGVLLLQNKPYRHSIEILGAGYSCDAHHMTHPSPDGSGAKNAMLRALGEIQPCQIDYINAHGTGTLANDNSEAMAIYSIFKDRPHVSSTKSITGHTLGAAGAIEAIICTQTLLKNKIPPNTNLHQADTQPLNLPKKPVEKTLQFALSNSLAFGGNNTSLLFGKPQ